MHVGLLVLATQEETPHCCDTAFQLQKGSAVHADGSAIAHMRGTQPEMTTEMTPAAFVGATEAHTATVVKDDVGGIAAHVPSG